MSNSNRRLKSAREFLGLSQKEIGDLIGKRQRTYAYYEADGANIPQEVREVIARRGINLHWLDTGEGEMTLPVIEVQPGAKGPSMPSGSTGAYKSIAEAAAAYAVETTHTPDRDAISRAIVVTWEEVGDRLSTRIKAGIAAHLAKYSADLSDAELRAELRSIYRAVLEAVAEELAKAPQSPPSEESPPG